MAAVVKAQRLAVPQVVATAETGAATAVDVTAAVMETAAETTVRHAVQWAPTPTPVPILALLIALPIPMPHGAMVTSDSVPQIAAAGKQKRVEYAVRSKTPISIFNTFIALIPTFLKRGKEICLQRRR
jgi:hypothetical protein